MVHRSRKSRKGRKIEEDNQIDRLSVLPDEVIIRILSKLDMKDAVQTGILSKRWKDLWTLVDNIVFKYPNANVNGQHMYFEPIEGSLFVKKDRYVSFIDLTLLRCTGPKIRRFYLQCFNNTSVGDFEAKFRRWIEHVIDKKAESVTLISGDDFTYAPDCLYHSSTLTELELGVVKVNISSPVYWSSLKSLSLMKMDVDDQSIKNMLVGSPVLESITLRMVYGIDNMEIMSQSVKKLVLVNFTDAESVDSHHMKISAPWIYELEILECFLVTEIQLVDVSSLVKAKLDFTPLIREGDIDEDLSEELYDFNKKWMSMVDELLQSLSHVNELIIGSEIIQVLSVVRLLYADCPVFRRCKHVTIKSPLWKFDLHGIIDLLGNGHHLETLSIKVLSWKDRVPLPHIVELFNNGDPPLNMLTGSLVHLKIVEIDYSPEYTDYQYFDFEVLKLILKEAVALEKLVLSASSSPRCRSRIRNLSRLISKYLISNKVAGWKLKKINGICEFSFQNSR